MASLDVRARDEETTTAVVAGWVPNPGYPGRAAVRAAWRMAGFGVAAVAVAALFHPLAGLAVAFAGVYVTVALWDRDAFADVVRAARERTRDRGFLVRTTVIRDGAVLGTDVGTVDFVDDWLVFDGRRTSFRFGAGMLSEYDRDTSVPKLALDGLTTVEFESLEPDDTGLRSEIGRFAITRRPVSGTATLPPMRPMSGWLVRGVTRVAPLFAFCVVCLALFLVGETHEGVRRLYLMRTPLVVGGLAGLWLLIEGVRLGLQWKYAREETRPGSNPPPAP